MITHNLDLDRFSNLFTELTVEHRQEVIDFMEFLRYKMIKKTKMHPVLQQELLERKRETLENPEMNTPEEDVYKEMEVIFGK